ncbi:MAG: sugar ABC transporter permease [Eubacteriales bacterium]|nr:sugar ABC transporter permease [Eubacteriales bacterium]
MKRRKITPYLYLLPIILIFCVLLVYPIYQVISFSVKDNVIVNPTPHFVGFQNFSKIIQSGEFWRALGNSLEFSIVSLFFHIILGIAFALMLNSDLLNSRFRGVVRALFIVPWTFTVSIVAILWRLMLNNSGIINTIFGLSIDWFGSRELAAKAVIFVNIWCSYPFYMISILAALQGISHVYYEAASIDGANSIQKFFKITVPHLKPVLISLMLLDFVWSMQQLSLTYITTGGGPIGSSETVGTYTYNLAFKTYQFSAASASAVIMMMLCLVIAIFYVRRQTSLD